MPVAKSIQSAIGVFFKHREIGGVVLISVGPQVAEDAQARLLIEENETAEIAIEGLDARSRGYEIVVVAQVRDLVFEKRLLQPHMRVQPGIAVPHVRVHHAGLFYMDVVDVDFRRDPDLPVDRLESRIAMEQRR